MSVIGDRAAANLEYVKGFGGPRPLEPALHLALVAQDRHSRGDGHPAHELWPGFRSIEQSARESVNRVKSSRWLPYRNSVRGFVFNVGTAELTEVD